MRRDAMPFAVITSRHRALTAIFSTREFIPRHAFDAHVTTMRRAMTRVDSLYYRCLYCDSAEIDASEGIERDASAFRDVMRYVVYRVKHERRDARVMTRAR